MERPKGLCDYDGGDCSNQESELFKLVLMFKVQNADLSKQVEWLRQMANRTMCVHEAIAKRA